MNHFLREKIHNDVNLTGEDKSFVMSYNPAIIPFVSSSATTLRNMPRKMHIFALERTISLILNDAM